MRPFEKEVERRYSAGGGRLISQHINSMLEAAYREHRTYIPTTTHTLNMEIDLQSLFGLHMSRHSCTHWLRPRIPSPHPPHWDSYTRGRYWSAKIDDISK